MVCRGRRDGQTVHEPTAAVFFEVYLNETTQISNIFNKTVWYIMSTVKQTYNLYFIFDFVFPSD